MASSETRSNLRAFRARHSSKFLHKSNSYTAFENGMENCHFTQRCSCHDFRRSHHQAFTVRMLHQQQKDPREMHVSPKHAKDCGDEICPEQWALHIWTIKCICWSQSTRQCIAEFPGSKALAIQGKLTKKTCHDSMMRQ